jgi:gliding motility-associated-like protein
LQPTIPNPNNDVILYVNKDYTAWSNHDKTFILKQNEITIYVGVDNHDGTITFVDVVDGMYRLYDGAENIRDEVIQGKTALGLSYYTVTFGVQNNGEAVNSTVEATYAGKNISSGSVVFGGKELAITATGAGAGIYSYSWNGTWNGNHNTTVSSNTITTTNLDGLVNVVCTVTGEESGNIYIARVLTPNNDNENDFLYIKGLEKYQSNEIKIINRFSTEVFKAKNYKNKTWNGDNLPNGVYFYSIKLVDANGAVTVKTGYFHLLK